MTIEEKKKLVEQLKAQKIAKTAVSSIQPLITDLLSNINDSKQIELKINEIKTILSQINSDNTKIDQIIDFLSKITNMKTGATGAPGYTPVKGVDYIDGLNGKDGKDGYTPIKGKDYYTESEKKEFVKAIVENIEVPKAPIKGTDYFTDTEIQQIISIVSSSVLGQITIPDLSGVDGDIQELKKEIKKINVASRVLDKIIKDIDLLKTTSQTGGSKRTGALNDLADVQITNPTASQGLIYDATLRKWKNSTSSGSGDMTKAVYDIDDTGVVDNSQALEGQTGSYYLDRTNHTGTQTASTISDFDTEVSNNTDVAANTAARHNAVTVSDTSSIDLTLTGQQISGVVLPAGVDHNSLANLTTGDPHTQYALKTYVDSAVVGLLDDRGNYDASTNLFPSSGGSGTAGAILKGDIWVISVAGTLGGSAVAIGDQVRALADTPGQTASNWAISEANIDMCRKMLQIKIRMAHLRQILIQNIPHRKRLKPTLTLSKQH